MIQAKDLRIGNYIADRGGKKWQIDHWESKDKVSAKSSISEIGGHKFEGHPLTEYVEYLQPIPLTEEILLKCGFEKIPHFNIGNASIKHIGRDRHISISSVGTPNEIIALVDQSGEDIANSDVIIVKNYDYDGYTNLHQLQNLYFALTGEELEIDL